MTAAEFTAWPAEVKWARAPALWGQNPPLDRQVCLFQLSVWECEAGKPMLTPAGKCPQHFYSREARQRLAPYGAALSPPHTQPGNLILKGSHYPQATGIRYAINPSDSICFGVA